MLEFGELLFEILEVQLALGAEVVADRPEVRPGLVRDLADADGGVAPAAEEPLAILVYLKADPQQLLRRLRWKSDRPVLADFSGDRLSEDELRSRVQDLYLKREPIYSKANITVLTDERKVGPTVDQIVRQLSAYIE